MGAFAGVDWAKDEHAVLVEDEDTNETVERIVGWLEERKLLA